MDIAGVARKPYPTDVSDEEWALAAPYLTLMQEVFNGLRWFMRARPTAR